MPLFLAAWTQGRLSEGHAGSNNGGVFVGHFTERSEELSRKGTFRDNPSLLTSVEMSRLRREGQLCTLSVA